MFSLNPGDEDQERWFTVLDGQPVSIAISRQGEKIGVGFERIIKIFNVADRNCEDRSTGIPQTNTGLTFRLDSQRISFSINGEHLVVATREAKEGIVYIRVYGGQPSEQRYQEMPSIRIPAVSISSNIFPPTNLSSYY